MSLRHAGTLVIALALTACTSVTQEPQTKELVFASFDSATGAIPLPNDLALQGAPTVLPLAQREVLQGYIRTGGFPSDVEVAITIPFNGLTWDASAGSSGQYVASATAPTIDPTSVTASTVVLLRTDAAPPTSEAYEVVVTPGLLKLRKPAAADGTRRWAGGRYMVAVRGGPSGVKTMTGQAVQPSTAIALAIKNLDLSIKENQPPGFPPALAAQLNGLRGALWNPLDWRNASGAWAPAPSAAVTPAFEAVKAYFPYQETVSIATFGIDKDSAVKLAMDSGAGQIPFPSDFLLESNVANCPTGVAPCIVNNAAFGAAAQGLRTLDGFSTTALLLAPLTGAIDATTVTWGNVHLFELTSGLPVRLKDLSLASGSLPAGAGMAYVSQPPGSYQAVGSQKLATTLVLAPAVLADLTTLGLGKYAVPPLKEKTRYVVVVTNRVKDPAGNPIGRSTVGRLLLETTSPLYGPSATGAEVPYISGVDLATAKGLQALRDGLAPLLSAAIPALTGGATTKADVAMIYTVTTQSVTATSVGLSAAPYSILPAAAAATVVTNATPAQWQAASGFPAAALPTVQAVLAGKIATVDPISPVNGALNPVKTAWTGIQVDYLATVPAVPAECTSTAPCARPVVVYHHGLGGSRYQMLPFAGELAAKGFVAVAIDAPFHGDRAFCLVDSDCTTGTADGVCTPSTIPDPADSTKVIPNAEAPATCSVGVLKFNAAGLTTVASGNYSITGNFFRSRDAIRRDLFDQSALVLAVAPPQARAVDPFADALKAAGVVIDPTKVYYAGQSLGAIIGTSILATNPRLGRGVLNVGGGTLIDILTTSAEFTSQPNGPGSSRLEQAIDDVLPGFTFQAAAADPALQATYLKLVQIAKWIFDPADPINYAASVKTKLASPLGAAYPAGLGGTPFFNATTEVYTQMAQDDLVVPNNTNLELDGLVGAAPTLYQTAAGGAVSHGYLISGGPFNLMQSDAANFLVDGTTVPASPVVIP